MFNPFAIFPVLRLKRTLGATSIKVQPQKNVVRNYGFAE